MPIRVLDTAHGRGQLRRQDYIGVNLTVLPVSSQADFLRTHPPSPDAAATLAAITGHLRTAWDIRLAPGGPTDHLYMDTAFHDMQGGLKQPRR